MSRDVDPQISGERAVSVLDQLPVGILCRDVPGKILGFNQRLKDFFPTLATPAAVGLTLAELAPEADEKHALHRAAVETGQTMTRRSVEEHYTMGEVNLVHSIVPLRTADGEIWGTASIVEDRTDLLMLEQDLARAQKLESVGQLAAGIAHEINTPMQYIGDNTHFLKSTVDRLLTIAHAAEAATHADATPEDHEHLRAILAKSKLAMIAERAPKAAEDALVGVENVTRIVAAMKRFSHPGTAEMGPVDVNESIKTTLAVCRHEWKYAAEVSTHFGDVPLIHGHLGELNQVWLNVVVNAADAIAERLGDTKGEITITTEHIAHLDHVKVSITDNGAGIRPENLERVLDPFFTTKDVGKGTGQGLTITHQVITQVHNGTLSIESVVGEGTSFVITLPTALPPCKDD